MVSEMLKYGVVSLNSIYFQLSIDTWQHTSIQNTWKMD